MIFIYSDCSAERPVSTCDTEDAVYITVKFLICVRYVGERDGE